MEGWLSQLLEPGEQPLLQSLAIERPGTNIVWIPQPNQGDLRGKPFKQGGIIGDIYLTQTQTVWGE